MKFMAIKKVSIWGMIGNVFLLIIKAIVGFITGGQAMLADAFNSASDIFSSIMTFIGNKIASKPRDDDHNLGHGKAEYIYSMFISIAMGLMSIKVIISAIKTILLGEKFSFSIWLVVVCIITIIVKFILYIYANGVYKKHKSLLLEANAKDHRNDCIITSLNLVACLLSLEGIYFVDSVVGIGISIWIFIVALKIFLESYDVLMDKAMNTITRDKVYDIISKHKEIRGVNHFNATPVGYKYQISFTIFVDGDLSTFDSHSIANGLEKEIDKNIPEVYLTVIHVNPIDVKK